jgi:hypothetical protein
MGKPTGEINVSTDLLFLTIPPILKLRFGRKLKLRLGRKPRRLSLDASILYRKMELSATCRREGQKVCFLDGKTLQVNVGPLIGGMERNHRRKLLRTLTNAGLLNPIVIDGRTTYEILQTPPLAFEPISKALTFHFGWLLDEQLTDKEDSGLAVFQMAGLSKSLLHMVKNGNATDDGFICWYWLRNKLCDPDGIRMSNWEFQVFLTKGKRLGYLEANGNGPRASVRLQKDWYNAERQQRVAEYQQKVSERQAEVKNIQERREQKLKKQVALKANAQKISGSKSQRSSTGVAPKANSPNLAFAMNSTVQAQKQASRRKVSIEGREGSKQPTLPPTDKKPNQTSSACEVERPTLPVHINGAPPPELVTLLKNVCFRLDGLSADALTKLQNGNSEKNWADATAWIIAEHERLKQRLSDPCKHVRNFINQCLRAYLEADEGIERFNLGWLCHQKGQSTAMAGFRSHLVEMGMLRSTPATRPTQRRVVVKEPVAPVKPSPEVEARDKVLAEENAIRQLSPFEMGAIAENEIDPQELAGEI